MAVIANPQARSDRRVVSHPPFAVPTAEGQVDGEGGSPLLTLHGFTGPLDHLLILARAQKIALADISLTALLDQLTAALRAAPATIPLGQRADWLVMAAWLVQLRTRLLLPADAPGQQEAAAEVDQLRSRLVALEAMQALAVWLEQRPQLGRDVFTRGRVSVEAGPAIDVVEFLWASLALFDDDPMQDTKTAYRPANLALHTVVEARERILRRLNEQPDGTPLDQLLPEESLDTGDVPRRALRRRSGWASTFVAGLELAKQGEVGLEQGGDFEPIHLTKT
jgi:segregation and condensation protein A